MTDFLVECFCSPFCLDGAQNSEALYLSQRNYIIKLLSYQFIQGFWYFARSRSREFQLNPRNPATFTKTRKIPRNSLEILSNTCRHNIFESYLGCWGCLLAVNVLIYLETSSLQRVNNILKLLGILRLMLRKTGKQRCKNPGVPSDDRETWGWECDGLFYREFALPKECRVLWRITPCTFISPTKMTIFFGTVRSTNDSAWKPVKWAKFMLVLTR